MASGSDRGARIRARGLISGLCVALALMAGTVLASAQSSIDRANTKLKVGQTKVWSITLDTSMILRVRGVTVNNADPDILITSNTGDSDERVWVDSQSGAVGIEEATAGLPGVSQGAARLLEFGEFMDDDRAGDSRLAAIQDLVRSRATTKR